MTTPDGTKSAKFSPEVHSELVSLARQLNGTMDDALRHLLGMSTVRVPITDGQRARWALAASHAGLSLDQFVVMRVEACLLSGIDHDTINQIFYRVDALCRSAGIGPAPDQYRGPSITQPQPDRPE